MNQNISKTFSFFSFFFCVPKMHSINNMYNSIVWSVGFMAYDNGIIRAPKFSAGKNSCNRYSQAIHTSSGLFSLFCSPQIFKLSKLSRYASPRYTQIESHQLFMCLYTLILFYYYFLLLNSYFLQLTRRTHGIGNLTKYSQRSTVGLPLDMGFSSELMDAILYLTLYVYIPK